MRKAGFEPALVAQCGPEPHALTTRPFTLYS